MPVFSSHAFPDSPVVPDAVALELTNKAQKIAMPISKHGKVFYVMYRWVVLVGSFYERLENLFKVGA
jgi:hypothetical protein